MSNCKPQCLSGTFHNDGRKISAHIREQHAAALRAAPDQIRRQRSPDEWRKLYAEAMAEKHKRKEQL
jgi:hypothetical protein